MKGFSSNISGPLLLLLAVLITLAITTVPAHAQPGGYPPPGVPLPDCGVGQTPCSVCHDTIDMGAWERFLCWLTCYPCKTGDGGTGGQFAPHSALSVAVASTNTVTTLRPQCATQFLKPRDSVGSTVPRARDVSVPAITL